MAFDDKNLERAMRREEKLAGIDLLFGGDVTMLCAQWMAVVPWYRLKEEYRKTLAAIVEALGYIPENEIVHIQLIKGEYVITHPLPEVIGEDVKAFLQGGDEPVKATGLSFAGWQLWQAEDNTIYACTGRGPAMDVPDSQAGENVLIRRDINTGEAVYRRTDRPREDTWTREAMEAWTHLEAHSWCRWDPDADGEIEGQEEIEIE